MKAVIIGAGIGGLTAAIALRQRGIDAQVYERVPALCDVGAGIGLWPNAVKALGKLGLSDAMAAHSLARLDVTARRWDGTVLTRTLASDLERRFGASSLILHRAELLEMLASHCGRENIRLGHEFSSFTSDATGVRVTFTSGVQAEGNVLIGADGLRSAVRSALGYTDPIRYAGYTAWRGVVSCERSRIIPGETMGRGRRFGIFPLTGDRVYWFATNNVAEGGRGKRDELMALFNGWHEPIEDLIRATPDPAILRNDIYDRDPLPSWGRGRATLLGDAAHPMTPNLGQGACQAIEDALELANCLVQNTPVEAALGDYETRRIPRTSRIVRDSRRFGAIGQIESPVLCFLRDLAIRMTPASITVRTLEEAAGYEGHLRDEITPGGPGS